MEHELFLSGDEVKDWETLMFLYTSGLKKIRTKIEILEEEYRNIHHYDPIEHISSRIKSPKSILRKLEREGHETDLRSMQMYLNDIAGIRIICSFTSDIYKIADMLTAEDDIRILIIKDYIATPKPNGYKSYHLIVTTPVYLSDGPVETKVEIQIRTIAMDFWASLEHKIFYKFDGRAPEEIQKELAECAYMINEIDDRMLSLNEEVMRLSEKEE